HGLRSAHGRLRGRGRRGRGARGGPPPRLVPRPPRPRRARLHLLLRQGARALADRHERAPAAPDPFVEQPVAALVRRRLPRGRRWLRRRWRLGRLVMASLFSDEEKARVAAAVKDAEARTEGALVVV